MIAIRNEQSGRCMQRPTVRKIEIVEIIRFVACNDRTVRKIEIVATTETVGKIGIIETEQFQMIYA